MPLNRERPNRVIAIDTSRPTGSVAAYNPRHSEAESGSAAAIDDAIFSETLATPADHARLLAGGVERTCRLAGWKPREADLVAVVVGPGSFTGLRVGVTAAKVLSWASRSRLVGVSSFDLLAHRGGSWALREWPEVERLQIALDAGRGEVHATTALRDDQAPAGWSVSPSHLLSQAAWTESLPSEAVVVSPLETDPLASRGDLRRPPAAVSHTTAADTAMLAVQLAAVAAFADPATLAPAYLRPSYAEEPRKR